MVSFQADLCGELGDTARGINTRAIGQQERRVQALHHQLRSSAPTATAR
jgi:hypothetical protein